MAAPTATAVLCCGALCAALLSAATAYPYPYPAPTGPAGAYDLSDPYCPYPQQAQYGQQYDYDGSGPGWGGLYGSGDAGYAQGYDAYSSYSGYGGGSAGGYGGGYADPSGRSASSFGVGFGRR